MTSGSWSDAEKLLAVETGPATDRQRKMAALAGISIADGMPHIVAAARLRVALAQDLHLRDSHAVREDSLAWIKQLWSGTKLPVLPVTQEEANGWIEHLFLVKRRAALLHLRPVQGDVVATAEGDYAAISSIGTNGRLYFTGGLGRGAWPDQVSMVARATDKSRVAEDARKVARNSAALRRPASAWSWARQQDLREFRVNDRAEHGDLLQLESIISSARDERPVQQFLQDHPNLLAMLVQRSDRFVLPQKRLGSEFVPDFIIGDVDSIGIHWTLIELESPTAPIYLTDGKTLGRQARKGIDQIVEWREWLQSNVAYARQPRSENGLGLFDIRGEAPALVLVGRRASLVQKSEAVRHHNRESSNIHVHTYDWLIESIRGAMEFSGPAAFNPFTLNRNEI